MGKLLHSVARANDAELPWFQALEKIQKRLDWLADKPEMDEDILSCLRQCFAVRAENFMANFGPVGTIHGDFQPGNVLVVNDDPDSELVLIDFDTTARGPLLWDFTLLEDRCLRGKHGFAFDDVLRAYGPVDTEVLLNACLLRDLHMAVFSFCQLLNKGTVRAALLAAQRYADLVQPRSRSWSI